MKIIFNKDIKYNTTKGKRYQTFGYYTDWGPPEVWHKYFLFLDDNLLPNFVNATHQDNEVEIIEENFPFETSVEKYKDSISIMPSNINWKNRTQIDCLDLGWYQLRNRDIWAVTQFVREANRIGFQVNSQLQEIAENELMKMAYVRGIIKGIFQTICNYFARCSNSQYSFRFNKIDIKINSEYEQIDSYKEAISENYYKHLVEYSDFGIFLNSQKDEFYSNESIRSCLKNSITEIVLTIEAIMTCKEELKVYEQKLKFPWEYSLIFLSKNEAYELYLGNTD